MLLDLNMWKNQIFYEPFKFGQYVGPRNEIFTVTNRTQLAFFNETYLTYAWRSNHSIDDNGTLYIDQDLPMHARFLGYHLSSKGIAFMPSIAAFVVFGLLVAVYGRYQISEGKRYFGRMKKRRLTTRKTSRRHYRPKRTASSASAPAAPTFPSIAEEGPEAGEEAKEEAKKAPSGRRLNLMRSRAIDEDSGGQNGSNLGPRALATCAEAEENEEREEAARKKEDETIIV